MIEKIQEKIKQSLWKKVIHECNMQLPFRCWKQEYANISEIKNILMKK